MDYGEQTTGTRDEHYNLISVLYHALHGAENCDRYASDAEIAGDERLAAFFRDAQGMQTVIAERAKGMLGIGGVSRQEVFGIMLPIGERKGGQRGNADIRHAEPFESRRGEDRQEQ